MIKDIVNEMIQFLKELDHLYVALFMEIFFVGIYIVAYQTKMPNEWIKDIILQFNGAAIGFMVGLKLKQTLVSKEEGLKKEKDHGAIVS